MTGPPRRAIDLQNLSLSPLSRTETKLATRLQDISRMNTRHSTDDTDGHDNGATRRMCTAITRKKRNVGRPPQNAVRTLRRRAAHATHPRAAPIAHSLSAPRSRRRPSRAPRAFAATTTTSASIGWILHAAPHHQKAPRSLAWIDLLFCCCFVVVVQSPLAGSAALAARARAMAAQRHAIRRRHQAVAVRNRD